MQGTVLFLKLQIFYTILQLEVRDTHIVYPNIEIISDFSDSKVAKSIAAAMSSELSRELRSSPSERKYDYCEKIIYR